jgi:hypothetical protein
MKIAVYIGGAQDGFDTPSSGEPRYAYNIAHMLALEGHEVTAFGTGHETQQPPLWGRQEPISGVSFVHPYDVLGKTFDVLINLPFELWVEGKLLPCEEIDIQADKIFHTTFSKAGLASICKNKTCWDTHKHHVMMPYSLTADLHDNLARELTEEEQVFADKYIHWLPFPYYKELNNRPPSERREMLWVCKSLFSDEWAEDEDFHLEGRTLLEATKNFANKNNITLHFAMASMFESERAKRLGVDKIFHDIQNKQLNDGLYLFSELNNLFSKSAVNLVPPNFAASCFNAIASGCVSLSYEDDFMFGGLSSSLKLYKGISIREVENLLEAIYFRGEIYWELIDEQREKIVDYSYAAAYEKFGKIMM